MENENAVLRQLINQAAEEHKLDPKIVSAIIEAESAFDPHAIRFEPKSSNKHLPEKFAKLHHISLITESILQQFSFGLMQIMGSTARWSGYKGALPALFIPETNLFWGCKYLAFLRDVNKGNLEHYIASYNAGSVRKNAAGELINRSYVDKVLQISQSLP